MYSTDILKHVVVVAAENAEKVDADGAFPVAAVDALRESGLLGLVLPEEVGGLGAGPLEFTDLVRELASACGSAAMVYLMHAAAAVAVAAAPPPGMPELVSAMASGESLGTLAFSERGSRSHFWAPVSAAALSDDGNAVRVRADKSWVTSAGYADAYVVSAGSASGVAGEVDLYAVPSSAAGLSVVAPFAGMGLRGNASSPDDGRRHDSRRIAPGWSGRRIRIDDADGSAVVLQPRQRRCLARARPGGVCSEPSRMLAAPGWSISASPCRRCRQFARKSQEWERLSRLSGHI